MAESKREVAVQALGWGVLFALPAVVCLLRGVVDDPDLGWHLRAGEWMVRQGDWPTVDQFSRWGGGQPWAAYSWLAEGMLWALYRLDGLRGVLLYTGVLASAIVAALWHLLRGCGSDRRLAGVLTLAGAMALVPLGTPRPWLFSILLFIVEMDLLLTAGRSGNRKRLLLLIPLFAVWANLHIQFTLGLAVLGLALVESLVARWARWPWIDAASRALSPGWLALVWGLSVLATLLSPYHAELYRVALLLVGQDRLWAYIQELAAPRFRSPADWLVLAAVLGAAFSLGRCRPVRLLLPMLLMAGAYFGFRSQRDLWVLLVAALATIASCWPQRQKAECEKPAETSAK